MKEIRWELILMPLVSIVLGIYLIMQPGAATVALCSLIGWLILLAGAAGAVNSVTFQRATFMTSPLLPVSVAGIMVGLFFITRPYTLVEIVGLIICVFLMIQGMTSIQTAVNRKRWGDTLWWVPLIIGIACVLLGVYALFAPGASTALMMRIAGIMLAFSGVVNMIAALFFLPGYGAQAQGMCQAEPGHVRHSFSGVPGYVSEDRGRGDAGHASGVLRGPGGLFPVLYLSVPPAVPECVQTAG